jgi:hypothetical protein
MLYISFRNYVVTLWSPLMFRTLFDQTPVQKWEPENGAFILWMCIRYTMYRVQAVLKCMIDPIAFQAFFCEFVRDSGER